MSMAAGVSVCNWSAPNRRSKQRGGPERTCCAWSFSTSTPGPSSIEAFAEKASKAKLRSSASI